MAEQLWGGLAHVKSSGPDSVLPQTSRGAFVNVVTYAFDRADFHQRVEASAALLGLTLCEIEDTIVVDEDNARGEFATLADELEPGQEARFGIFHNYLADTDIN